MLLYHWKLYGVFFGCKKDTYSIISAKFKSQGLIQGGGLGG